MRQSAKIIVNLFIFICLNHELLAQREAMVEETLNGQHVSRGNLKTYKIPFNDTCLREVAIWTPANYNPKKKYATIYMHDGQMLYDSTVTWNRKEWRVDETSDSLISNGVTRPFIVVGIYNDPPNRYAEFFPQQTIEFMDSSYANKLMKTLWNGELRANHYIDWISEELIPFVENRYAVSHKREDRFLIGSSMGGLISLYGITRNPKVFGGAACLSIHTPMINFQLIREDAMRSLVLPYNAYLMKELPSPKKVKLYIDRGTETLDAYYGPYHEVLMQTLSKRGYQIGAQYMALVWDKTAHDEVSWAKRLAVPMKFLLIKD